MSNPFVKVELGVQVTPAQEYAHVTYVDVLPYVSIPDVLIWGSRVFVPVTDFDNEKPRYREAFAVVVWTEEEMKNAGLR